MSSEHEQKILTKIKKLKAMEESAREIGNENEALAFAARVQQMLHSYKLEMAQVDEIDLDAEDAIEVDREFFTWDEAGIERTKKRSHWLIALADYVCHYNGCKVHGVHKSNMVGIVGTESSRAVVTWLLVTLARYGRESMEKAYRTEYYQAKKRDEEEGGDYHRMNMKGFRRAFVSAYVSAIGQRMKKQWEDDQAKNCTERGLMIIDKEKEAVEDFWENLELVKAAGFRGAHNVEGAQAGRRAGEEASIKCNGVQGEKRNALT